MALVSSFGVIHVCSSCGATPTAGEPFQLRIHYRWRNGHGAQFLHFCRACGQVETITSLYSRGITRKVESWRVPSQYVKNHD